MNKDKKEGSLTVVFGKKLSQLRKERQMTQEELAEKIGMSRSSISYYESWTKNPTLDVVQKFSDFFNIPPENLLYNPNNTIKNKEPTKVEAYVNRLKKMTPHKQRNVLKLWEVALESQS